MDTGLAGKGIVDVSGEQLQAKDIVIATGSAVARIPLPGAELTIDSDQILELKEIPRRLAVIGGGVVGMEFAAMFAALGSKVTVLEMLPTILPMVEADLLRLYVKHFQGLPHLKSLSFYMGAIGDAGLEHLKALTSLTSLDLRGTRVSDGGLPVAGDDSTPRLAAWHQVV